MSTTEGTQAGKLWGGRFSKRLDSVMEVFNSSIGFDQRLWDVDLTGSVVYARALANINLITDIERDSIIQGLESIRSEWKSGSFEINSSIDEDIHTANERRLKELIGPDVGGKLHTGRSRNEQTALDTRMWLREACKELKSIIIEFIDVILERADREIQIMMPGYTHMQRAQPVLWSHWLLSHAWALKSDLERLNLVVQRIMAQCPLGSGALAGNPFSKIDRYQMAKELGFSGPSLNSMHTVGDRDFIAEFQFWASLTAVHLSKLSEDLIIYSTHEFGFVQISDEFSTGSSLMPQKKNADSLELIRGKSGRIIGNCTGILVLLKGLPSTYSKDMQEDKESLFETFDQIKVMLQVGSGVVKTLIVNEDQCASALSTDMMATDVAYYLVRKGVAFREAHELAGKVVAIAESKNTDMSKLNVGDLQNISSKFGADVIEIWNYRTSVAQYGAKGGTAECSVREQINELHKQLLNEKDKI